jgi:hypothetical protein
MSSQLTLGGLNTTIGSAMVASESTLGNLLLQISAMTSMGVADMVQVQYAMANYTVAGQTMSAIMKDITDTFKSVVQKIG